MSSASSPVSSNAGKQFYGTGRRRESIARVYIKMGPARFTVNGRPVEEYFRNIAWHTAAVEPLKFTQMQDQIEVKCIVKGGGDDSCPGFVDSQSQRNHFEHHVYHPVDRLQDEGREECRRLPRTNEEQCNVIFGRPAKMKTGLKQ